MQFPSLTRHINLKTVNDIICQVRALLQGQMNLHGGAGQESGRLFVPQKLYAARSLRTLCAFHSLHNCKTEGTKGSSSSCNSRGRSERRRLRKPICGNCREIAISATVMGQLQLQLCRQRGAAVLAVLRELVK